MYGLHGTNDKQDKKAIISDPSLLKQNVKLQGQKLNDQRCFEYRPDYCHPPPPTACSTHLCIKKALKKMKRNKKS